MKTKIPYGIVFMTSRVFHGEVIKRYIGQHKLKFGVIEDGYLGSGDLLRAAVKKHGRQSFTREILEICHSREHLNEAEVRWIAHFDATNDTSYYNIALGGEVPPRINFKDVFQYDLSGEFVRSFSSLAEAAAHVGCKTPAIGRQCKGDNKFKSVKGFQWSFEFKERMSPVTTGCKRSIIAYDFEGNEVQRFEKVIDAANTLSVNRTAIIRCCSGKSLSAGGFQWKYSDSEKVVCAKREKILPTKAVLKVDPKTGDVLERFESLTLAASFFDGDAGEISAAIKRGGACRGFLWKYEDSGEDPLAKRKLSKSRRPGIVCFTLDGKKVAEYKSQREVAAATGIDPRRIADTCRGRYSSYAGFKWKYADD